MQTILLAWNPKKWPQKKFDSAYEEYHRRRGRMDWEWSCYSSHVTPGDRIFLLRQGVEPRGLVGAGSVISEPYKGQHYNDPTKITQYIYIRFDTLLHPEREPIFPRSQLDEGVLGQMHWNTQVSGIAIPPKIAVELERQWKQFLTGRGSSPITLPDEVLTSDRFWEGTLRRITVNAYERDPVARQACINHYGCACVACAFSFPDYYGEIGNRYIHVHHLTPLSDIRRGYAVDPIKEMRPVCPNCHAMIHRTDPPLSIAELKRRIRKSRGGPIKD